LAEEFKYLAVKNWKRFQPKNTQNLPWIRDYKERDFDDKYSKLTCMQRYMMDACCRLRGRRDSNLPNDPQWICSATAVLPRERHNATTAIQQLVRSGLLLLTNQQYDLLGEERKGEERKGKESIASTLEEPPKNSDLSVQKIAEAHPKNIKPVMTEHAIVMQVERLAEVKRMTPESALEYLMERTQLYAAAIRGWPETEFKFVPESHNWFADGSFAADEKLWEWKGITNANGTSKIEQHRIDTRKAIVRATLEPGVRGSDGHHRAAVEQDGPVPAAQPGSGARADAAARDVARQPERP
jgi:hypothetical protein